MTTDKVMEKIRGALGNPTSGPIADAMPLIEAGVRSAFDGGGAKETRVVKAAETRADDEGE